jgi:hypothetical protein
MALGTPTLVRKISQGPIHTDQLTFAGDGAYPAGGTVDFEGYYREALKTAEKSSPGREVLAVIQVDASGYVLRYDKANDKLMVFEANSDAADGPLQQSSTANLSGTTFSVIVLSI